MTNMKMCGMCRGAGTDAAALQRDKEISRQLREWKREEERIVKLLMLGTGESGKSTVTKQMKIIHINGFNDVERREKIADIRRNLRDSILTICGAMNLLNIRLADPTIQASVDYLMEYATDDNYHYPQEFYEHTIQLWRDRGVQQCYRRSHEYQLLDCAKYFLDRIAVIRRDDYLPTDQDILRCRVMTNTIHRIDFSVKDHGTDVQFSVFDVGGQQGERRKWIQVFDSATAILFVLDCSSFDTSLREDPTKNRLLEAAEIFEQVWNSRFLRYVSIILFINKIDLLEEKINSGKSLEMLLDVIPPDNPYNDLFQSFRTFKKPKEGERREFLEQFPHHTPGSDPSEDMTGLLKRRKSKPHLQQREVNEEVIRTAIFIKRIFMSLLEAPRRYKHGASWHENHTCEYFYTCAVDTHTIKKVLEGCRSLIIKKYLDKMGINLY